jgi:hypothetical protein
MRYRILKENVTLVFLKDISKWKKGDKIILNMWVNEVDPNKRCYYLESSYWEKGLEHYILYDNQITPLEEFRENIIDFIFDKTS